MGANTAKRPLHWGAVECHLLPTDNPQPTVIRRSYFRATPLVYQSETTEPNPHTYEKWTKTAQKKKQVKSRQVTAMRPNSKLDNFLQNFFSVRGLIRIFWYYEHCSLEVQLRSLSKHFLDYGMMLDPSLDMRTSLLKVILILNREYLFKKQKTKQKNQTNRKQTTPGLFSSLQDTMINVCVELSWAHCRIMSIF